MTMPIPTAWTPLSPLGHHNVHSPAGSASIGVDGAIEVRDCEGRLRVRFDGREAEIITEGELALSAQSIRLEAAEDVTVIAGRRSVHRAPVVEFHADQLVEHARDLVQEVGDQLLTRAGRVRSLVREGYSLLSRRTVLKSEKNTTIDGERILLG